VPAHAAVDEAVQHATHLTHRGGGSFANALLRSVARSPKLASWPVREADATRRLAIELSHPDFLVERWIATFGRERAIAMLQANNQPKPLQLLAFRGRGGREQLAEDLIDEGLDVVPSSISPLGLTVREGNPFATKAFRDGAFYVQDEASQAAALVPPPRAGERILDAAAAPGGKTAALLAWESDLRLVAADRSLSRLSRLRSNLRRLRLDPRLVVGDATASPFGDAVGMPSPFGDAVRLPSPFGGAGFDRVVLDLPCSGTGTLRKHPELKWRISPAVVGRLAQQGEAMLDGAAPSVARGGLLVAITCSLEPEENELVVAHFLSGHPEFRLLALEGLLPGALDRWVAGTGFWRLPTGGDHDGFTVHVMERRGAG
jgi:16S rRNA (cytosine967-C5)-methyltransferase